jgi:uncharacterized membrane protein
MVILLLSLHVVAGTLALMFGYTALYASKGAILHRRSGRGFVYVMVAMSLSGAMIAAVNDNSRDSVSIVAGLLTGYLVITAVLAVHPRASRNSYRMAMIAAVAVAAVGAVSAVAALAAGRPEGSPGVIFALVAALCARADYRLLTSSTHVAAERIKRHLWRMCFAMWIAAASFFWGPSDRVPEIIRIPPLQAIAVLTPIAVMAYWLWRLRARRGATFVPAVLSKVHAQ